MITVAGKTRFSPDDLLTMPDGDRFELVNGNLVERNVSVWSSYVAGEIHGVIRDYCRAQPLGWVFPEGTSYQCFPGFPDRVRRPDVSFIRLGRLAVEQTPEGHVPIPPDLAVEVLSPNDLAYEVDQKVEDYLQAGVRLVWVVNPNSRTVRVHRADRTGTVLRETDELTGEEVLPGFRCSVRELFRLPAGSGPAV